MTKLSRRDFLKGLVVIGVAASPIGRMPLTPPAPSGFGGYIVPIEFAETLRKNRVLRATSAVFYIAEKGNHEQEKEEETKIVY